MRYTISTSFCLVLLLVLISAAEEEFQPGTRMEIDSVVALKNAISFLEAGFQRGETGLVLKVISDNYKDANIQMTRATARSKVLSIILKKEQAIGKSSLQGGIYFNIGEMKFKYGKALVDLRMAINTPTASDGRIKEISSDLEFERFGGGWVLTSSDGFLGKMLSAYDKPDKMPVAAQEAERQSEGLEVPK